MSEGIQISAKLERTTTDLGQQTPWGFRLQGGKDFSRPLTILRVTPGSLADKCGLMAGDMIMKIGEHDVSNAFHKDAQAYVMKSGDSLDLAIQRGGRAPMPMLGGGDYPMYNEDNSGYLNPNPQYGTPHGPGPREYAAQNVSQQMSNLNLNPKPAPYSPQGQQGGGYTDETDASNNNDPVAPPKDNDIPPELPSSPPPVLPACPPPDFQPNQPQRVVKKQYNSPAGLYAAQPAGDVKAESYTHSIIKAAGRPAGITETSPAPSIPEAPPFELKKSETYRLLKKEEEKKPQNNGNVQNGNGNGNGSNSLPRKSKPKPLVNDDPDREPMHSRSFKMLQQQLQSDTYGKEPLPPAMALRQGSPNPDRRSPLPAKVSPNPATNRKISPVPFRPTSPRASSPQMRSVSPQMAPERKMTPPSIAVTPEVTCKTVPAGFIKQYNSPAGLYSAKNAAAAVAPPADATVQVVVERPIDEPLPDFADDGSKLYRPQFSDTWKLLQEKKDKGKADAKTISSEPPAEPKLGRTMNSLRQQLTTEHREPGLQPSAPAMRPSQPPAPAWQPRHVPPAPVAVPNAQVSGHKWQPPSVRPAAPHQGQFGAPSSGRGGTRGRKGDASMRQGDATRIPVCSQCGGPVRGPFVLALGKSWCPNHFCCANCNCKLIDIGFIEEGGKLYCEKDYEMYFAPHCKKCNQAIIGDCVHAMNFEYHPHCFVCTHCRQPIGNSGFHMEDGQPFCERDWMQMFQTKCAACDFPVEPGDHWVEAMGSNYHADCFCCAVCRKPLEGQTFYAKDGRAYCSQHNKGRF